MPNINAGTLCFVRTRIYNAVVAVFWLEMRLTWRDTVNVHIKHYVVSVNGKALVSSVAAYSSVSKNKHTQCTPFTIAICCIKRARCAQQPRPKRSARAVAANFEAASPSPSLIPPTIVLRRAPRITNVITLVEKAVGVERVCCESRTSAMDL